MRTFKSALTPFLNSIFAIHALHRNTNLWDSIRHNHIHLTYFIHYQLKTFKGSSLIFRMVTTMFLSGAQSSNTVPETQAQIRTADTLPIDQSMSSECQDLAHIPAFVLPSSVWDVVHEVVEHMSPLSFPSPPNTSVDHASNSHENSGIDTNGRIHRPYEPSSINRGNNNAEGAPRQKRSRHEENSNAPSSYAKQLGASVFGPHHTGTRSEH